MYFINLALILLVLSIIIQLIATMMAFRMMGTVRGRYPWLAIALALSLMTIRRIITFSNFMFYNGPQPNIGSESVALIISILMLIGISQIYPAFLREIESSERTQNALHEALLKAENANKAKSEFLANMSHDLRTPLNAMMGFSEMMVQKIFGPLGSENYEKGAQAIHSSSHFLLNMINDILDLSTIEAGEYNLKYDKMDVKKVVDECIVMVSRDAETKGVSIGLEIEKNIPPLWADPKSFRQIFINIISNAIKYSKAGGEVYVNIFHFADKHSFEISDHGIGIAKESISHITEPFVRSENDPHKAHEGTGLGLAIVKSLVTIHRGQFDISSQLGVGTKVSFTLPSKQAKVKLVRVA